MPVERVLLIGETRSKFLNTLKKHYTVALARSGKVGCELAQQSPMDAIVLDAVSMQTTGERICRALRNQLQTVPIVHIHPGPQERVNSPADVVLLLPLTARHLVQVIEQLGTEAADERVLYCGGFRLNVSSRLLVAHGREVQLTPKQAALVKIFLEHPHEVLPRKRLMQAVWNTDYVGDTRTLDVHIRWVRRAFANGDSNKTYVHTVRGVGYQFIP